MGTYVVLEPQRDSGFPSGLPCPCCRAGPQAQWRASLAANVDRKRGILMPCLFICPPGQSCPGVRRRRGGRCCSSFDSPAEPFAVASLIACAPCSHIIISGCHLLLQPPVEPLLALLFSSSRLAPITFLTSPFTACLPALQDGRAASQAFLYAAGRRLQKQKHEVGSLSLIVT